MTNRNCGRPILHVSADSDVYRMLVLTRRRNQRIHIAENISITLLEIRGQQARIGIEAPTDMLILREELRESATSERRPSARRDSKKRASTRYPQYEPG